MIKDIINPIIKIKSDIETLNQLREFSEDSLDEGLKSEFESLYKETEKNIKEQETLTYLSGKFDNNASIFEIHAGAGGTESCDWAMMLSRMYTKYFNKKGYTYELIDEQPGEEVGIKSITYIVRGTFSYGYLKNEKGVHRLVRLSPFDSNNRRHTSFAAVDVIPEFDENVDVEIKDADIRIDVYRSSGAGGQGVNTTDSAVRLTHIPTGLVVYSQTERSQIKNKEKAIKILKARLYDLKMREAEEALGTERRNKIGTGDRSEKIRTYNYPQNRVTDHRIGYTTKNLDRVMDGDLDDIINALIQEDQKRKLKGETEE